ncbi:hypothetical protein POM88_035535 [Heracleum sosnowskyi]|uniref:Uncharacterized protein n=1 Tax=Heracleum sosnowskyi TaxID=360622 RepID=A0AAD8HMK1_9APIA|nr:hypothetical protein POM88_035535 [Heracleum sosnowskyi]
MFQAFSILRYKIGQKYNSHYDAFHPSEYGQQKSQSVLQTKTQFIVGHFLGRNVVLSESGQQRRSIGTGGLKAAAPSLGADQFDEEDPEEAASLSVYFKWLIFSIVTGAIFGVTFLVWVM